MQTKKTLKTIFKNILMLGVVACASLSPQKAKACDPDDELPGALPPAPNGGQLGEMEKIDKKLNSVDTESASPEERLYWEGVYVKKDKKILLSLVKVLAPKTAIFTVLSPEQTFSNLQLKVELPRERKFITVPFSVTKDRVTADFDAKDLNRFIVHVEGVSAYGTRRALVQIEEE